MNVGEPGLPGIIAVEAEAVSTFWCPEKGNRIVDRPEAVWPESSRQRICVRSLVRRVCEVPGCGEVCPYLPPDPGLVAFIILQAGSEVNLIAACDFDVSTGPNFPDRTITDAAET